VWKDWVWATRIKLIKTLQRKYGVVTHFCIIYANRVVGIGYLITIDNSAIMINDNIWFMTKACCEPLANFSRNQWQTQGSSILVRKSPPPL
jgi:hypothetical protein